MSEQEKVQKEVDDFEPTWKRYDGNLKVWPAFQATIQHGLIDNVSLSSAAKLIVLQKSLTGKAAAWLADAKTKAQTIEAIWPKMITRFNHPVFIKERWIHYIVTAPTAKENTIQAIESVLQRLKQLQAHMYLVESGNQLRMYEQCIISIATSKLHMDVYRNWHNHGRTGPSPTLLEFITFLNAAKTELRATGHQKCILCQNTAGGTNWHNLEDCPKFNARSIEWRLQIVETHRHCACCLNPAHQGVRCMGVPCNLCHKPHHRLLCPRLEGRRFFAPQKAAMKWRAPATITTTSQAQSTPMQVPESANNEQPASEELTDKADSMEGKLPDELPMEVQEHSAQRIETKKEESSGQNKTTTFGNFSEMLAIKGAASMEYQKLVNDALDDLNGPGISSDVLDDMFGTPSRGIEGQFGIPEKKTEEQILAEEDQILEGP